MPSKNPEVLARAQKNWRKKNPAYLQKWRAANPEKTAKYNEGQYEKRKAEYRAYYHRNRERILVRQSAYRAANPEKSAERQMMTNFGITLAEKKLLWLAQDKKCAICRKAITLLSAHIDHVHDSDPIIIRGLLCGSCNRGLGLFQDIPTNLERAASYLRLFTPNTEA